MARVNVTDTRRATQGLTTILVAEGAALALFFVNWAVMSFAGGHWEAVSAAMQMLWLGVTATIIVGLVQLSAGVDDAGFVRAVIVVLAIGAVVSVVDMGALLLSRQLGTAAALGQLFTWVSFTFSLVERAMFLVLMVRLGGKAQAWLLPLAALIGVLIVLRFGLSAAFLLRGFVSTEFLASPVLRIVRPALSLTSGAATLAVVFGARAAVASATPSGLPPIVTPAMAASTGAPTAEPPAAARDLITGAVLLVVGIAITALSYSAASGGGRYVVATGAIGVGIGQLIRGFIKLGKGA